MSYFLFTDGGARGNPGPASIGVVIKKDEETIFEANRYIGETTNNVAEYTALIAGLQALKKTGIKKFTAFLDSELIVKQVNGQYKVKDANLQNLHKKVSLLLRDFDDYEIRHVKRSENKRADKLVNLSLDDNAR